MPELKRNFAASGGAKMNKDMDERLVPAGQYRDALNIQIATSDGSDVGSAQTILGNTIKNEMDGEDGYYGVPTTSTCVGSIALPEEDKVYYLVSGGTVNTGVGSSKGKPAKTFAIGSDGNLSAHDFMQKDYILEYDTVKETLKYVFVDIYNVEIEIDNATTSSNAFLYVTPLNSSTASINKTGIRIGMQVHGTMGSNTYNIQDGITVSDIQYNAGNSNYKIFLEKDGAAFTPASGVADGDTVKFTSPRVLSFDYNKPITAINIIDDLMFWSDNNGEPKKINITRSIAGTGGTEYLSGGAVNGFASGSPTNLTFIGDTDHFHTRLVVQSDTGMGLKVVTDAAIQKAKYVALEDITVIKRAPTQPLELEMSRQRNPRITTAGVTNLSHVKESTFKFYDSNDEQYKPGDVITGITFDSAIDFRVGDIIIWTNDLSFQTPSSFDDYQVRCVVETSPVVGPDTLFATPFSVRVLSISDNLPNSNEEWYIRLEDGDPMFEFKFVRFSYRYKYADGEYSPFAPFSQVAFLPDNYEYFPKKGFNRGMRNQLRGLKLKGYHPELAAIPREVVEIDLLYKETNNPTVYTVKTIKPTDKGPMWPDLVKDATMRGEFEITTDLIHAVVPSNQLIRPYDNVPRKARAQEVTANRLVYGNYLQNYTIPEDPIINLELHSDTLDSLDSSFALPSVKTLRNYQVGVVFSDDYGRETPVLTNKNSTLFVPKEASTTRNRILAKLGENSYIPAWAKYFSWYIKETSSEYYTMAMDRWYNASDGNIWLSFPSSERNKVDEESFLILKKAHNKDTAIEERARYKILAIESEAPDFVKTERKSLGFIFNSGAAYIGTSNSGGYPLIGNSFVTIQQTIFDDTFGDDFILKTPDSLFIRFAGQGVVSKEYEVTNIALQGTHYKLKTKTPFGVDVDFASTDGTLNGAISDLTVELKSHEIENRPEFDGRFFVKVFRDEILSRYVLTAISNQQYQVSDSQKLRYLDNNSTGASATGIGFDSKQQSAKDGKNHPHDSNYDWAQNSGNELFGIAASEMEIESHKINLEGFGPQFWQGVAGRKNFFLDAASAYSLTGRKANNNHDVPGQISTTGYSTNLTTGIFTNSNRGCAKDDSDGAPNGVVGNTKSGRGQISRGIWGPDNRFMDIAWTGMFTGYASGNWNSSTSGTSGYAHKLQDVAAGTVESAGYKAPSRFIQQLVQPDTKFRFQRDPDLTVYTVEAFQYYEPGATYHPHGSPAGAGTPSANSIPAGGAAFGSDGVFRPGDTTLNTGIWGIRNYETTGTNKHKKQYEGANLRQRWTIQTTEEIGGTGAGYRPDKGTQNITNTSDDDYRAPLHHDTSDFDTIEILVPATNLDSLEDSFSDNPAIWETEPKETVELDIYYQASGLIPLELNESTNEEYLPLGTTFRSKTSAGVSTKHEVTGFTNQTITFTPALPNDSSNNFFTTGGDIYFTKRNYYSLGARSAANVTSSGSTTTIKLLGDATTFTQQHKLFRQYQILDWNNCWCFGNGVESDRIRDDFNAPQMDNGVKASSVLAESVKEERREHGLIYSGIYNSQSGVNNLNQFIAGEKITKDLNPVYGSIQKLYASNTDLITLCEDKVLRVQANKDALFNADGDANVIATDKVLGQAIAYPGNYGISTNPESFAATPYGLYFADAMRGQVLTLRGNEIQSISNAGMKDYFSDNLKSYVHRLFGSYDDRKGEYNLTIAKKYHPSQIQYNYTSTVSYKNSIKGWTSFKSFYPESGVSLNNNYYTFKNGQIYKHHDDTSISISGAGHADDEKLTMSSTVGLTVGMIVTGTGIPAGTKITAISALIVTMNNDRTAEFKAQSLTFTVPRNNFYGTQYESDITVTFNDSPEAVKSFNTVNYEGTQAKVTLPATTSTTDAAGNTVSSTAAAHNEYFNLANKQGWYVDSITTNKQTGDVVEFKEKEGKWFGNITGDTTDIDNVDEAEFSIQGLGTASFSFAGGGSGTPPTNGNVTITFANNAGTVEDSSSVLATEQSHFSVTSVEQSHVVGSTVSSQTVNLTISPIINGVHSGYNLTAANFTAANVDSPISGGTFTDNGIAGDPNNTVNVAVAVGGFTCPTTDTTYFIDIDESTAAALPQRTAAVHAYWVYSGNQTVTITNITSPAITETTVQAGSSTTPGIGKFVGDVNDGETTKIAEINFASASGYNYKNNVTVTLQNMVYGPYDYSNQYTTEVEKTYSSNVLDSFKVKIFYTPASEGSPLYPDPASILELNHIININSEIQDTVAAVTNTITGLTFESQTTSTISTIPVTVNGIKDTAYIIKIAKMQDLDPATSNTVSKYWNFTTNAWQASSATLTTSIPDLGYRVHYFQTESVTADTRYDIVIATSGSSTIPTDIDGHGEAFITQKGVNTLTIKPKAPSGTIFAGSLAETATKTKQSPRTDKTVESKIAGKSTFTTGGNGNVSGSTITLDQESPDIDTGMLIIGVGSDGVTSSHNTTVVSVDKDRITMSKELKVPDGTTLRFEKPSSDIFQFELSISGKKQLFNLDFTNEDGALGRQPSKGVSNILTSFTGDIAGFQDVTILTNGSISSATTLTLDTTKGIVPGMTVTGTGISGTVTVSSVTNATQIVLSSNQTIGNDVSMTFATNNPNVEVLDIQATKEDGDIKVQGVLKVNEIEATAEAHIYVDSFTKVT